VKAVKIEWYDCFRNGRIRILKNKNGVFIKTVGWLIEKNSRYVKVALHMCLEDNKFDSFTIIPTKSIKSIQVIDTEPLKKKWWKFI